MTILSTPSVKEYIGQVVEKQEKKKALSKAQSQFREENMNVKPTLLHPS
jgi:hypothetical protein